MPTFSLRIRSSRHLYFIYTVNIHSLFLTSWTNILRLISYWTDFNKMLLWLVTWNNGCTVNSGWKFEHMTFQRSYLRKRHFSTRHISANERFLFKYPVYIDDWKEKEIFYEIFRWTKKTYFSNFINLLDILWIQFFFLNYFSVFLENGFYAI